MKHFVYRVDTVRVDRGSGTAHKRVTLYRIVKNQLRQVSAREFTYESDGQAAVTSAIAAKQLKPLHNGNGDVALSPLTYSHAGVADFTQV